MSNSPGECAIFSWAHSKERHMSRYPNVWHLRHLIESIDDVQTNVPGTNEWVPARPLGFMSIRSRFSAAWLVFTGKADALLWPSGQ